MATRIEAVTEELQVALRCDLVERIREDAERAHQTVDEWVAEAARRHLEDAAERDVLRRARDAAWAEALRMFDDANGPIDDEEMLERTPEWPD